ncbi:MAG: alpha/beta hydrolase [Alphaproteobacteria bacterium]|nr:alpha/beta hydrolase [Alphaproteobacteria bacterium]MBU1525274.1 alpha/beta hydrolase [Alphaproteobacteria bacterium]MBU2118323.1 alpha/beta hydrolase [Alphaproteobacteria bacterium]MBU2351224.1 alpha/beta hydrolase [Alphaproteobacteria bacterium]MBU2383525.1 alpha/beta hydrolase [Alphaproteobacteria bacterium]
MINVDRRALLIAAGLTAASPAVARPPDEDWPLWPAGVPGRDRVALVPEIVERATDPAFHDRIAVRTIDPLLTVVRPDRPNGASLLLIPGGGYRWAVVDKEGLDCARVFADAGVTCFVLRYRLPGDGWPAGPAVALQDAQRAMRLIRSRAAGLGLDPARVAVLGASAGGHLAGCLTASTHPAYESVDAADELGWRPDLTALLYPVVTLRDPFAHAGSRGRLLGDAPTADQVAAWSLESLDWRGAPPTFLLHAMDDAAVPVDNSLMLLATLRAAGVPAEAHLFEEGGHGFGIRLIAGRPAAVWPDLLLAFGRRHGWLA